MESTSVYSNQSKEPSTFETMKYDLDSSSKDEINDYRLTSMRNSINADI
jgi:hypothetical protein